MNDDSNPNQSELTMGAADELAALKNRARLMGITFSNNISVETLKRKIEAKMDGAEDAGSGEPDEAVAGNEPVQVLTGNAAAINPLVGTGAEMLPGGVDATGRKLSPAEIRQSLQESQMKLVRLRITCMDPKKKELPGEILTVANDFLGTVRKYVPYGEQTENGYHVPFCIYQMLKDRKFLHIQVTKNEKGQEVVKHRLVSEFALEVLPPLTESELAQLRAAQAAAGGLSDD